MKHTKIRLVLPVALILMALSLSACGSTRHRQHGRKQYSQLYVNQRGEHFARTYDGGEFLWWIYLTNLSSDPNPISASGTLHGGSWSLPAVDPTELTATSRAVQLNENAEPTETTKEVGSVPGNEMTDAETSPSEAVGNAAEAKGGG